MNDLGAFQQIVQETFGPRDAARGRAASVAWLCEEVGELAQAVRKGSPAQQLHELGDVLAWVASLANQLGLSLDEATERYARGCPACRQVPCGCAEPAPEGRSSVGLAPSPRVREERP